MNTQRRKQVEKLRKLLALCSSPNVHEAEASRKLADQLMLKHGITEDDVRQLDDSSYFEVSLGVAGWNAAWRFTLVTLAAQVHGAKAVALRKGAKRLVKLCGSREVVEKARSLFERLLTVVKELERKIAEEGRIELFACMVGNLTAREISDAFRRGAVAGIVRCYVMARRKNQAPCPEEPIVEPPEKGTSGKATDRPPEGPTASLIRLDALVKVSEPEQHDETVREKYSPKVKPIDIVGDSHPFLFNLGFDFAMAWVKVGPDYEVSVKCKG